jgi:hypothetical protein
MIEDISLLQRIIGSASRLAGLSARLEVAQPLHRWGDFTDVFRERDWRARMDALREERATIVEFDGGPDCEAAQRLAWTEVIGKSEGAAP